MPNHVKNKVLITGCQEKINILFDKIKMSADEEQSDSGYHVDFKKIIPYPAGTFMDIEANGNVIALEKNKYPWQRNRSLIEWVDSVSNHVKRDDVFNEVAFENIVKALRNKITCGYACWYDWCVDHWGTKWGAYDQLNKIEQNILFFETAWNHPAPIYNELSKNNPELFFEIWYADEDYGSNYGHFTLQNEIKTDMTAKVENPIKFAVELHGDYKSYDEYLKACADDEELEEKTLESEA